MDINMNININIYQYIYINIPSQLSSPMLNSLGERELKRASPDDTDWSRRRSRHFTTIVIFHL